MFYVWQGKSMNIFISYSRSRDEKLAKDLAAHLQDAGHHVWYSGGGIFPGENPGQKAGRALEKSDAMLVLVSPDSMRSSWVRQEIDYALGTARFAGRVVPIIVKPTKEAPWIFKKFPTVSGVRQPREVAQRVLKHLQQAGS